MATRAKTKHFSHQGRDYEVRSHRSVEGYVVQVYHNDEPVIGPHFTMAWETDGDFDQTYADALNGLIDFAAEEFMGRP